MGVNVVALDKYYDYNYNKNRNGQKTDVERCFRNVYTKQQQLRYVSWSVEYLTAQCLLPMDT